MPNELETANTMPASTPWSFRNGALKKVLVGGGGAGGLGILTLVVYHLLTQQAALGEAVRGNREQIQACGCAAVSSRLTLIEGDMKQVREAVMFMRGRMEPLGQ